VAPEGGDDVEACIAERCGVADVEQLPLLDGELAAKIPDVLRVEIKLDRGDVRDDDPRAKVREFEGEPAGPAPISSTRSPGRTWSARKRRWTRR